MNRMLLKRRLQAHAAGRALPLGDTIRLPIAGPKDRMLLAFVKMGGESAPWGVAYKTQAAGLRVLSVPEPRNRDAVADMLAQFAPAFLEHLYHPGFSQITFDPDQSPLRQVWVPNPTHIEMLHLLAHRYVFARRSEDQERLALLNALGRASGWAFREHERAGQAFVISATEALRSSYVFPADDTRQGHLGFLLAWLEGDADDLAARWERARMEEAQPIATSLDPALERDELEPAVEEFHRANDEGQTTASRLASQRIHGLLEKELQFRIGLVERSLAVLEGDPRPVNPGCRELAKSTLNEQLDQYLRVENKLALGEHAFVPDPATDRQPAAAAARYNKYVAASEQHVHALVHHDHAMQLEQVEAGDGILGRIVEVRQLVEGRKRRPIWILRDSGTTSLRLREGSDVCVAGVPGRVGRIREIESLSDGSRLFTVEITKGKTTRLKGYVDLPPANSPDFVGQRMILLSTSHASLSDRRAQRVWAQQGPGAWLTHAKGY